MALISFIMSATILSGWPLFEELREKAQDETQS